MLAVTATQMGRIDGVAVLRDGEAELVRQAGVAIAAIVSRHRGTGPIVAFARNGNNGGDAFAALAELGGARIAYHDPAHDGSATRVRARERAQAYVMTSDDFAALLPRRSDVADKRSSGAPLVIAGSEAFPGAAILCALGAARAGAGYVTLAVPRGAAATVRAQRTEQVVVPFDETNPAAALDRITTAAAHCNAIAIGPGLSLKPAVGDIVRGVVATLPLPMVADASALHHLAGRLPVARDGPLILTPHEGEFALISRGGAIVAGTRPQRLRAFVDEFAITMLLKGRTTLVADRTSLHLNPTGSPALATAGTGDVLSGIVATLLSQGLSAVDAGRVGAFRHGRAGERAAKARPVGVVAGDVADALRRASRAPRDGWPVRIF